ncbi:MAG: hypothetical protein Q9159_002814, partial [Coniocarpon cinnabarinum]
MPKLTHSSIKGRPHYYSRAPEEFAHITFDLDLDLSTLFTWNTKQVFLYITTTYPTAPSKKSSAASTAPAPATTAILWDAILQHPLAPVHVNHYDPSNPSRRNSRDRKSKSKNKNKKDQEPQKPKTIQDVAIIKLEGQKPKYHITDPSGRLSGRTNTTLELNYNIQPWVGALTWGAGGVHDA